MISRESVMAAVFALGESMTWNGGQTWATTSRRFKMFSDMPNQPAFCQLSEMEATRQTTGMDYIQRWYVRWFIYHLAGADPTAIPDQTTNAILDAAYAAFAPNTPDNKQTLGGLVHHAFIDGTIRKTPGDLDDQAMIILPITILVPSQ